MSGQTRRGALLGGAAAALVIAGGVAYEWPHFAASKFEGPNGDLIAKLPDAKAAALVGRSIPKTDADRLIGGADALRQKLARAPLTQVIERDAAYDRLNEVNGWVLPQSLALLCAAVAYTPQPG